MGGALYLFCFMVYVHQSCRQLLPLSAAVYVHLNKHFAAVVAATQQQRSSGDRTSFAAGFTVAVALS